MIFTDEIIVQCFVPAVKILLFVGAGNLQVITNKF